MWQTLLVGSRLRGRSRYKVLSVWISKVLVTSFWPECQDPNPLMQIEVKFCQSRKKCEDVQRMFYGVFTHFWIVLMTMVYSLCYWCPCCNWTPRAFHGQIDHNWERKSQGESSQLCFLCCHSDGENAHLLWERVQPWLLPRSMTTRYKRMGWELVSHPWRHLSLVNIVNRKLGGS